MGLIFLFLTCAVVGGSIVIFSWSFWFKKNIPLALVFLACVFFLAKNTENINKFLNKNLFFNQNQVKHFTECSKILLEFESDECFRKFGILSDNPDICKMISSSTESADCLNFVYRNRGSKTGDKKWCELITDPYQKSLCNK